MFSATLKQHVVHVPRKQLHRLKDADLKSVISCTEKQHRFCAGYSPTHCRNAGSTSLNRSFDDQRSHSICSGGTLNRLSGMALLPHRLASTTRYFYSGSLDPYRERFKREFLIPYNFPVFDTQRQFISGSSIRPDQHAEGGSKSKIEHTLELLKQELKEEQKQLAAGGESSVKLVRDKSPDKKEVATKKLTVYQRVKRELLHYYHGFRLLWLDIKVARRLLWEVLKGINLNRKERKQLVRTVSDLFRLVPFSIFIVVPFMEFLLPVVLYFFPGMLPSTFQEKTKEEEKLRRQLRVKLDMARFLQDTLEELSLERKKIKEGKEVVSKSLEFAQFIKKIRAEGGYVSNAELLKFSKLFEDELTLDSLTTPQLRALCRIVTVQPIGTPNILRFQLNMKLRELKADDKLIASEGGVDRLTVPELQAVCRARGMRALGLSVDSLKNQLRSWLELSLNDKVPPSLLLLSRAMFLPEEMSFTDRLKNIFSILPDSVAEEARLKLTEMEGSKVDNKAKLEMVLGIEAALKKERALEKAAKMAEKAAKLEAAALEKAEAEAAALEPAAGRGVPSEAAGVDLVRDPKPRIVEDKHLDAHLLKDKAKVLDAEEIRVVEEVLHEASGKLHEEKEDLVELKEQVQEHKEDVEEAIEMVMVTGDLARESKAAKRLQGRVDKIISRVDSILNKLDVEKKTLGEELVPPEDEEAVQSHRLRLVAVNDLVQYLKRLQKIPDETKMKRIVEVLEALDDNHDGTINLELALEVIELIGKDNVDLKAEQLQKISELLRKEDKAAELEELMEAASKLDEEATKSILRRDLTHTMNTTTDEESATNESLNENVVEDVSKPSFKVEESAVPPLSSEINKQSEQRL